jgi:hypothetical protein
LLLRVAKNGWIYSCLYVYDFDKNFRADGTAVRADQLQFYRRLVSFVPCDIAKSIEMSTRYDGAIRAVGNEDGNAGTNALEYDDQVSFYKFSKDNCEKVTIDKSLYYKKAYKVVAKDPAGNQYILQIAAPVSDELDLFEDDQPQYFLQWLREQIFNPVAANFSSSLYSIYFENTSLNLRIPIVKSSLSVSELSAIGTLNEVKLVVRNP